MTNARGSVASPSPDSMLDVAFAEARLGLAEGGIPIGADRKSVV